MRIMMEAAAATLALFGSVLAAQTPSEPGASPGVSVQDISHNGRCMLVAPSLPPMECWPASQSRAARW